MTYLLDSIAASCSEIENIPTTRGTYYTRCIISMWESKQLYEKNQSNHNENQGMLEIIQSHVHLRRG